MKSPSLLALLLAEPVRAVTLGERDWEQVVRQGWRADLLGTLQARLRDAELLDAVPPPVRMHLDSAHALAERHAAQVRYEVARIADALRPAGLPLILLKGAAYAVADLPPGRGRLFNDIDILVPEARIAEAERALVRRGWIAAHHDAYDQRYYRQWMHEIPPLRHVKRRTVIDVHHNILPRTARIRLDASRLIGAAQVIPGTDGWMMLSPPDLLLHCAVHLFHEGEFAHGLRDLVDFDALLTHFGSREGFVDALAHRAAELDGFGPLHYALRYLERFLCRPVPESLRDRSRAHAPLPPLGWVMDGLFSRALQPDHPSCHDPLSGFASWLLYLRGHWLRMPPHLLIPHLVRKAFRDRRKATRPTPLRRPAEKTG